MEKYPLRSEFAISADIALPLCRKEEYVYLLSGRKWRVLEDEVFAELKNIFDSEDRRLIYFPKIFAGLSADMLAYNFPGVSLPGGLNYAVYEQDILEKMGVELGDDQYAFVRFSSDDEEFLCYVLSADNLSSFILESKGYLNSVLPADMHWGNCSVIEGHACEVFNDEKFEEEHEDDACKIQEDKIKKRSSWFLFKRFFRTFDSDRMFTSEQSELLDQAIGAVRQLQLTGVPFEVITKLLEPQIKLSRVVITRRFRILLPDYDKEIKMGPLPKTLFLFFLKHDCEFMFSELMDYKEELLRIYEKVSNRDDKGKMQESIQRLTDPLDNSICEKCTAVRNAFLEEITYEISRNYFIEGKQGEPKRIHLNRNLVEWEGGEPC